MSVAELREAVRAQDGARLTKIPGIGKKTAERLLLELRDRLDVKAGVTVRRRRAGAGHRRHRQRAERAWLQ